MLSMASHVRAHSVTSVIFDALRPHGLKPARLLCPWVFSWSGLPCLPRGDLPDPGIEAESPVSPASAGRFFTTSTTWGPVMTSSDPATVPQREPKTSKSPDAETGPVWPEPAHPHTAGLWVELDRLGAHAWAESAETCEQSVRGAGSPNDTCGVTAGFVTWSRAGLDCHLLHELPWQLGGKESAYNARNLGLIPGSGRSPGAEDDDPPQYSCLRNPMDRGAWRITVHGVGNSWIRQCNKCAHVHYYIAKQGHNPSPLFDECCIARSYLGSQLF